MLLLFFLFVYPNVAYAYLDPGTGSYVFQVLIAAVIGGLFAIKMYWQKIRNFFSNRFSRKQDK